MVARPGENAIHVTCEPDVPSLHVGCAVLRLVHCRHEGIASFVWPGPRRGKRMYRAWVIWGPVGIFPLVDYNIGVSRGTGTIHGYVLPIVGLGAGGSRGDAAGLCVEREPTIRRAL